MKKRISRIMAIFLIAVTVTIGFGNKDLVFATNYVSYKTVEYTVNGVTWSCRYEVNTNASSPEMGASYENIRTSVIGMIGSEKTVEVPREVKDSTGKTYPVTMISESCFKGVNKIKSIIINENITKIEKAAFSGCENLETVILNTNAEIPVSCFSECANLKKIKLVSNNIGAYAFYGCDNLECVELEAVGEITLDRGAFSTAKKLNELRIGEQVTKLTVGHCAFAANSSLKELKFPCKTFLRPSCFFGCGALTKVEFGDEVTMLEPDNTLPPSHVVPSFWKGTFASCFDEEYKDGKLVEKEVIFHKNATLSADINIAGFFEDCTGLTKVTFKEDVKIGPTCFYNCKNLKNLEFEKNVTFNAGIDVFSNCDNLKELAFHSSVYDQGNANSVFTNSKIESLTFDHKAQEDAKVSLNISSANELKTVSFDVAALSGSISDCDALESIIFKNNKELEWLSYNRDLEAFKFEDKLTQKHFVFGYSSKDLSKCYAEQWCKEYSTAGTFRNIIDYVETSYDGKLIGEDITTEDIDLSKIKATAYYSYDLNEKLELSLSKEDDTQGFVPVLPNSLKVDGSNTYWVYYSGVKASNSINVIAKKIEKLQVNWNEDKIKELVANQPVTISDLVTDASAIYNDGEIKTVSLNELNLETTKTIENTNTFTVTLKADSNIKDTYTTEISPNYITDIEAVYLDGSGYVGQSIDIDKIKIYPHYKYDEDPELNRDIVPTKISNNVIMNEGENIIEVSYGDISTELIVCGLKVVPTDMTAYFDSDNYKYIDGQKEIDKNSIKARVNYNDGTYKEIDGNMLDSIEIVSRLSTEVGVKVKYQNIEAPVFYINVTPKLIEKIQVSASIKSAIEGTTLLKSMISEIDVVYDNGVTETLTKENIDYDKLTLKNTEIKANVENNIIVEYLGKTDTVTIIGIPNTITGISAVYTGAGIPVGNKVTLDEVKVTASNANGVVTEITSGCLLENAMIYNVGFNKVIVHYGAFQCELEVKGLAAMPTVTAEVTTTPAATATVKPTATPIATSNSSVTSTPVITPTVLPDVEATNEPVQIPSNEVPNGTTTATKSAVTVTSSIKTIKLAKKKTYKIVTNKKVVLTCKTENATDLKYQFVKKGASVKSNKWKTVKKNKISITDTSDCTGILYISYKDYEGNTKKIYTSGFKIDKKKATVNVKNNKTYKKGKKLTIKDASGIKSAKLDGKNIKTGKKVTQKGKHTLVVVDKAGNKTKINFMVK